MQTMPMQVWVITGWYSKGEIVVFSIVNYVAVGSMEGMVELFDVDLVDQMEPLHTFGKKSKKKKTKTSKKVRWKTPPLPLNLSFLSRKQRINPMKAMMVQYSISVGINSFDKFLPPVLQMPLSLYGILVKWKWHYISITYMKNRSVSVEMIWNNVSMLFVSCNQIQSISWHPIEAQNLLSGSSDRTVCLIDCRDANNKSKKHRWTFDSDIERVTWNTFDGNQFLVRERIPWSVRLIHIGSDRKWLCLRDGYSSNDSACF